MRPYFSDDQVTLWHGDALAVLRALPSGSVDCCVTSPPYFGLRDYGQPGQYGLEPSPAAYVETMRTVFAEVRRVLADDGTCWVNLGDSYSGSWGNQGRKTERGTQRPINGPMMQPVRDGRYGESGGSRTGAIKPGAPAAKNLMGMPWRVAFALQDDGWILRNAIVWAKPNAMPESVTDRVSTRHELIFLLTKSRRYWFDLGPIREPLAYPDDRNGSKIIGGRRKTDDPSYLDASGRRRGSIYGRAASANLQPTGVQHLTPDTNGGRNPGDVWTIPTQPFPSAHFAVFPVELPRRAIAAGCRPGGTVLDPFSGSGTTGMAAAQLGRRYVGIDLSAEYLDLSLRTRLAQPGFTDGLV